MLAYIDPGSGAMLLQWLMAGVLGSIVFFRRTLAGIFFKRKKQDKKTASDAEGPNDAKPRE